MRLLKLIIFLHCFISSQPVDGQPVPMLLWGETTPELPALYTMHTYELQQIIYNLLDTHMLVVFNEDDLTNKDLLCFNTATNDSCFHYMRAMKKLNYYAQVHNPIETIEAIASEPPIKWRLIGLHTPRWNAFACRVGEVHGFEFRNKYESRTEQLTAHDAIIAEFSYSLACPLVLIYTTRRKQNQRRRLSLYDLYLTNEQAKKEAFAWSAQQKSDGTKAHHPKPYRPPSNVIDYIFVSDYFAIRYQFVYLIRSDPAVNFNTNTGGRARTVKASDKDMKELVTISGMFSEEMKDQLGFTVSFESTPVPLTLDVWTFRNYRGVHYRTLTVDTTGFATMPFRVPENKSYCCALLEASSADKSRIQFVNIQMQAMRFVRNTTDQFAFGDPVYCTGALTPNIMAGLVIGVLMVAIAGFGLVWILDIGSNAHMDDPNGPDVRFKAQS